MENMPSWFTEVGMTVGLVLFATLALAALRSKDPSRRNLR